MVKKPKGLRSRSKGRSVDPTALQEVKKLLDVTSYRRDLLIEYLHKIQDQFGHLSAAHLVALAHEMKLAPTEVYEVATFYHHFDVVRDGETPPPELTVRVCDSVSCEMAGAQLLLESLQGPFGDMVRIQPVPCVGRCEKAPVAVVGKNPIDNATLDKVSDVVKAGKFKPELPSNVVRFADYQSGGGYQLAASCLNGDREPDQIIEIMENSGLRGLGGAGFPAGRKWRIVRDQPAPRLMAVNIDEGEPGTFKDRVYLETDPHRFLEGMLISAWAVGIDEIYIYIRDEYPHCQSILEEAIHELQGAAPCRLPRIEVRRGAGAYICGEESAMIESIEGKRGIPRLRPPYVAEVGLFDRPTLEHNLETLYWVRDILEKGADWFNGQGRRQRTGLRSFSVSGRVKNPGVHLAPAGISMRELIDEYCGGMMDGHEFYGYFPGGASGGILPASLGDLPLDFDTLQEYGCFIGSAAIIVLSNQDSAKQAALNAMRFFAHESCGKCTPCRVGTSKSAELMTQAKWDVPLLEELAETMMDASICGLGQAAPNPLLSVIKYFPEELN